MQPEFPDKRPDRTIHSVFTIFKTSENELTASGSEVIDLSDKEILSELYDEVKKTGTQTGVIEKQDLRFYVQYTPMGEAIVFADITNEKEVLIQLAQTCGFIAVLSFGVFFIISVLLARLTVNPVETAWNQQKQFVADASHELKTPLTVIMTNAEMLLDDNYSQDKRMQFSESILVMAKQMRELTESLLELARSDNNSKKISYEDTDLSSLISEAVLPFEPLYYEKELVLDCQIQDNIIVRGDSIQLCRLADILLDNAMKYSHPQTEVTVSLKKHRDYCILSVISHGDTISKSDLKNIFKRFYRVDKVRNAAHSYGLGLSIAESIVNEHNGRIWAESSDGKNIFRLRLQSD
jgi:signal transduction histidine kinase